MDVEKLASDIEGLLPDRDGGINAEMGPGRGDMSREGAESIVHRSTARELARIRYREKDELRRRQELLRKRQEAGVAPGRTLRQQKAVEEQEALVTAVERLEGRNGGGCVPDLIAPGVQSALSPKQAAALRTTTRRDVARLLSSLGVDLDMQLTKKDTSDLLACLLTCSEEQLDALYGNRKVPVAVKTVIKRLLKDVENGSTVTVEKLWDRLFGKAGLSGEAAQAAPSGIVPDTPISREAYIILRDTLIR